MSPGRRLGGSPGMGDGWMLLGVVNDAISRFSTHSDLNSFWSAVCDNFRWVVPSRRLCVLVLDERGDCRVAGRIERGDDLGALDLALRTGDDFIRRVMAQREILFEPLDTLTEGDPVRAWLRKTGGELELIGVPLYSSSERVGAIIGVIRRLDPSTRLRIEAYAKTYALHAGMTYRLIRLTEERQQAREELRTANEELRNAHDQAVEASKAKSSFLANMSHDLRTPLNAILGYTDLLRDESADNPSLVADLDRIHRSGLQLLNLISDILDLSKVEAGKLTLDPRNTPVAALLDDLASTLGPALRERNNEFRRTTEVDALFADPVRLEQILQNLLSNAAKFTQDGVVKLEVRAAELDGAPAVAFCVSDTGIGMTAAQLRRIFNEYEQAELTTSREFGGTGLGLAITRRLSAMMGGRIDVESVAGEGTSITVTVPRDGASTPAPTKPEAPTKPVVIAVDDDPLALEFLERILSAEGLDVHSLQDPTTLIELARSLSPTIIVLDVKLPQVSGWELLGQLKADVALRDIPVIMVTVIDDQHRGMLLGCAEYIVKPFSRSRLISASRQLIANTTDEILVVEDDPETREMLARGLAYAGFSVTTAGNGIEALARIKERVPGLVMLDLEMPAMDGFEFLARVGRDPALHDLPIIVVTASELAADQRERLLSGVAQVVEKRAYTSAELVAKLRHVIVRLLRSETAAPLAIAEAAHTSA